MMGPEAMGIANANLRWSDEKVCRNFLCGTCPHTLFTNTVSVRVPEYGILLIECSFHRKWTLVPVPSHILSDSKPNFWRQKRPPLKIQFSIGFRWNTRLIYLPSLMNAIVGFGRLTGGWRRRLKRMQRLQTWLLFCGLI